MFKPTTLVILFILCFISLNTHIYAADSDSAETEAVTTLKDTVENNENEDDVNKSSPQINEETEEDEDPDCWFRSTVLITTHKDILNLLLVQYTLSIMG